MRRDAGVGGARGLGPADGKKSVVGESMDSASRLGLAGRIGKRPIAEVAAEALSISLRGLNNGAACVGDTDAGAKAVERLAAHHRLELTV